MVGVVGLEILVVGRRQLEACDHGLLQRSGSPDGEEVVDLAARLDHPCRREDVADAPAGDGVGLGERVAHHGALPHARQRCEVGVVERLVDDVLVHLVGDDEGVVLLHDPGYLQELIAREHPA